MQGEVDVRKRIYDCIASSPGLHFREIQRRLGLATGSVDYHLHFLHRQGLIREERVGKFVRYYAYTKTFEQEEKDVLALLRQNRIRHILVYLLEKKRANALDIANSLGISPSTLSWYLKQLTEKGVIAQKKKGRFRYYSVVEKEKIAKYLILHKASFLDEIVDRFIEAWEE
ncbi:MAG: winged helix-turn-helix transcriptional regulator [Candidatus Aenigmarchaeota archaeon]|nr:winged helix-turn-helix transcriptional regulator [Candidatus Aenigmarchaeota archaeon]